MGKAKKKKGIPEGACPFCHAVHDEADWDTSWLDAPPWQHKHPNILIVLDDPEPSPRALRMLERLLVKEGAQPALLYARCGYERSTTVQQKVRRATVLQPTLDAYPNIPIVCLGDEATTFILGGNHTETSIANKVYEKYDRVIACTYSLEHFILEQKEFIFQHIETTIHAALQQQLQPEVIYGRLPDDLTSLIVDVETSSPEFYFSGSSCHLLGLSKPGGALHILRPSEITEEIRQLLRDNCVLVIGHNLMFDLVHCHGMGITFPNAKYHDTMIYHKNMFPNEQEYGLKSLAKKYFSYPHWEAWFHSQLKAKVPMAEMDWHKLCIYNSIDLLATNSLYQQQKLMYAPFLLEMDYMQYVYKLIINGFYVQLNKINALIELNTQEAQQLEQSLRDEFNLGADFNFCSPEQVGSLLHRLGISVANTQEATLLEHAEEHPFLIKFLRLRNINKFVGTSLEGLKYWIDVQSRVHSVVAVHGAETGRSSSSKPNLQNTDPRVRACFMSRYPEGKLLYTDLSALEYRLIAHIAKEPKLIKAFREGQDIHCNAYTACFNEVIDKKHPGRQLGKTINYAGVYGCGKGKFYELTGLEGKEGDSVFKKVSNLYPAVNRWKDLVVQTLQRTGRVRNLYGRVRQFERPISQDDEREAINWIIQSSGHDILKIYLMEAADGMELLSPDILLVSEVHDSFTLDVPVGRIKDARELLEKLGGNLNPLIKQCFGVEMSVPMLAEVKELEVWR